MLLSNQLAWFLAANDFQATTDFLPPEPDRLACVYAADLEGVPNERGALMQIVFRGPVKDGLALYDAARAEALLRDFEGLFCEGGDYILRVKAESGPTALGADARGRCEYSLEVRVWGCGSPAE